MPMAITLYFVYALKMPARNNNARGELSKYFIS